MKQKSALFFAFSLSLTSSLVFAAGEKPIVSTLDQQQSVELTVYNSNLGLVKDTRLVDLPQGSGELRFMDVASGINPVTVHVKSLSAPQSFAVLDQNYEYDLISEDAILNKYIGEKIKLQQISTDLNKKEMVEATLLSNNAGQVYQINNEIYLGYPGLKILPALPENLVAKPTLTWLYSSKSQKPQQLEVSYLTSSISWKSDYVVILGQDDKTLDLSGWVTIDNQSGAAYNNARLKLIAGEVNRVQQPYLMKASRMAAGAAMMESDAPQFQEKAFFDYHIYDLQRKATLKDKQIKQITLLEANGVSAQKEYLTYGNAGGYYSQMPGSAQKQPVNIFIKFKNSKENKAGMPLPEGTIRVYKKDTDASLQFVGEDSIKHTPKDEEVRVKIGEAFDMVVEKTQTDYKQLAQSLYETEWEITLRNHKDEDVTVGVVEPMYADWEVLKSSQAYKKADARTLRFDIPIVKNQEVKLTYRIRVKTA